jgi:hypothetical protein
MFVKKSASHLKKYTEKDYDAKWFDITIENFELIR